MRLTFLAVMIAALGMAAMVAEPALAQTDTGAIFGAITDVETHEPIAGATVQIMDTTRGAVANQRGEFRIENVEPGTYRIRLSLIGYQSLVRSTVEVNPGRDTEVHVEMSASPVELGAITVKAQDTYFEEEPEAEVSGRTIDTQEITLASGGLNDVQRVVQALPSVTSGSDGMNEIIVRGGNYNENLFIMDGIEIPNPNHFAFQNTGGGVIPLLRTEFIKDVTFLAGAFPARYGDKASSVMDIELRRGSRDRYLTSIDMSMGGLGFMTEGPAGKNGSFLLSARRSYLDLVTAGSGIQAVPLYHNIQGKLTYTLGRHTLLWNTVIGSDDINFVADEESDDPEEDESLDYSTNLLVNGLTVKSALSPSLYSELTVSDVRNKWQADVWEGEGAEARDMFNNNSTESETTLKYNLSWFIGGHELSGGFSVKNSRFDHNIFADGDTIFYFEPDPLYPDDPGHDIETDTVFMEYNDWRDHTDVSTYKGAGFVQARLKPTAKLTLRLGGRYDWFDYTDESHVSPRVGLRYQLTPTFSVNSAYGVHYQSPSYLMLTAHKNNRGNLESYKTEQVVLGTEWLPAPDIRMTLEGYSKWYRDVPVEKSWTTPDPWDSSDGEMVNAAKGHAEGIELYVQKKMSTDYQFIVSYSYYRAFLHDPRTGQERPWDFDHRNMFTLSGTQKWRMDTVDWYQNMRGKTWFKCMAWILPLPFGDEVFLSGRWRFAGGRPYTKQVYRRDVHSWVIPEDMPLNTERYGDYHRLDIRLDRKYYHNSWTFTTYLDIVNIYGHDNIWDYAYEDDGKREQIDQFSTLPIGGFIIEF